jgi:ABC-2 type transport system permease protein
MNSLNAITTIAFRDITKLFRDKGRIIANFVFPVIFIGILGTSLQANIGEALGYNFLTFVFIGVIGQTLFQSTAAGVISLVEDRQNDFAQELFVAPVPRQAILMGKIIGETLVAMIQVVGVVIFGLVYGIEISYSSLVFLLPFMIGVAIFGGAFGIMVMSGLSDQRSANQIFPFLLFPQFFLAGVFNPIKNLPPALLIASRISPLTYGVDLLRSIYYWGRPEYDKIVLFNPAINISVIVIMSLVFLSIGTWLFVKKEREK